VQKQLQFNQAVCQTKARACKYPGRRKRAMSLQTLWNDMFVLGIPILEKILRPIIVYVLLIVGLRLAGKRELAQLNPFDLVVLLTLSNTVQNAIIGNDNSITGGIIGAATLLVVNSIVVRFLSKERKIDELIEGSEDILIDQGKIQEKVLEREIITLTELEIAAHKQGIPSLDQVDRAVLEPGGGISFMRKEPQPEDVRQMELIARLDALSCEMAAMRAELKRLQPGISNLSIG
jgi:uncharacterized membrane protein YcaP (DUF421 family)